MQKAVVVVVVVVKEVDYGGGGADGLWEIVRIVVMMMVKVAQLS